jgi:D-psicose/D-tagatose/L-ribulose 3-epimerase
MFAIGANPWIWESPVTTDTVARLAPRLAEWGFDAIELPVENVGDWAAEPVRETLDAFSLAPAAVIAVTSPGRELVEASAETIASTQDYVRACVDLAVEVGAPSVCGPLYSSVGRTWRLSPSQRLAVYRQLRESLAPLADYAGERGIKLGLEALNRYETSVLNTISQTLEALDGVADNVGIMLDAYHMNIEETDPYAAVTLAGPRLVHVQVSGSHRGAPGDDHLNWPKWMAKLAGTGYRGPVCLESFTGENEAIAVAAAIWRPLAKTQDALARDGLAYLRSILSV